MVSLEKYLYFPKCKITRADSLPGYNMQACTFFIKSLQNTPKHYPQHFMLKGKADFFFKLNGNGISWKVIYEKSFLSIFGSQAKLNQAHKFIGLEVSVLAYFDEQAEIKLDCIGIGLPHETPILFNNNLSLLENESFSKVAVLGSKLSNNNKKEKKQKI